MLEEQIPVSKTIGKNKASSAAALSWFETYRLRSWRYVV